MAIDTEIIASVPAFEQREPGVKVEWFDNEDQNYGIMQVWHGDPVGSGRRPVTVQLGYRSNFSRDLEEILNTTLGVEVVVTESSKSHCVYRIPGTEQFTMAKLTFDGQDLLELVRNRYSPPYSV